LAAPCGNQNFLAQLRKGLDITSYRPVLSDWYVTQRGLTSGEKRAFVSLNFVRSYIEGWAPPGILPCGVNGRIHRSRSVPGASS
jgi:hypothetical protein